MATGGGDKTAAKAPGHRPPERAQARDQARQRPQETLQETAGNSLKSMGFVGSAV